MKKVVYGLAIVLVLLASISCGRNDDEAKALRKEIDRVMVQTEGIHLRDEYSEIAEFYSAIGNRLTHPKGDYYDSDMFKIYGNTKFNIYTEKGIMDNLRAMYCQLLFNQRHIEYLEKCLSYDDYRIKKLELENAKLRKVSDLKELEEEFNEYESDFMRINDITSPSARKAMEEEGTKIINPAADLEDDWEEHPTAVPGQ